jgi:cytidine deaminase
MNKEFGFKYTKYDSLDELPPTERRVVDAAREACRNAYAPYSDFHVGAAALLESGRIITGSNQESEVFPAGICAERNLLFRHGNESPDDKIVMLAIASMPDERECYPCGICRQVLNDFQKRQGSKFRVIMTSGKSATAVDDVSYLLPFTFQL